MRTDSEEALAWESSLPLFIPAAVFATWGTAYLSVTDHADLFDAFLALGPGVSLALVAIGVSMSDTPPTRYRRILGMGAFGAVVVSVVPFVVLLSTTISIEAPLLALETGTGLGTLSGMLVGFNEARAQERAKVARRNQELTEQAREEQARLEHLNHLLRHDILNNVTVIQGYAEFLLEDANRESSSKEQMIKYQADATIELIQNVRAYMESVNNDDGLQPKDLSAVLSREMETLKASFPDSEVESDIPDAVYVRADDLVGSVFSNLMRNALVHNEGSEHAVSLTVNPGDESVTVTVADNGPGIPEPLREVLFEPTATGDHGFGLFLVKTLVERYNGTLTVEKSDSSGTTISVELLRADPLAAQS